MLSSFGSQAGADEVATALNAEGAAIVEHLIAPEMVAYIRSELERHCQLNGSQPDMTTAYCGHDFFEYPIL
jgi:hypothetical protein